MADVLVREARLGLDEALTVGAEARSKLKAELPQAMVTWRNASQAAGQLQNAILTDGQHWYALVDDEHAVKDVAGDVEILLRGGGEASTQVHSAWLDRKSVV